MLSYLLNHVCDDNFFKRKLSLSYPDTLKFYEVNKFKNYKNFYLNIIFYIAKLQEDFNYLYVGGNPKTQYNLFKKISKEVSRDNKKQFLVNYQLLLRISAETGELELVKEAIERGVEIHENDEYALRLASYNGQLEVIKYLVSLGADIHANDEGALRYASENGHLEVVKYLSSL